MDPSKVVVYDADGRSVAETPYCRDVITWRVSKTSIRVFGIALSSSLCNSTWDFDGKEFHKRHGWRWRLMPVLASLFRRWFSYAVVVSLAVYGITGLLVHFRTSGIATLPGFRGWLGV